VQVAEDAQGVVGRIVGVDVQLLGQGRLGGDNFDGGDPGSGGGARADACTFSGRDGKSERVS
jgi:hypothetical protein